MVALTTKEQNAIIKLFKTHFKVDKLKQVSVNARGELDVTADKVTLRTPGSIPVKLGTITGDLDVAKMQLTSLNNCAHTVKGRFWCEDNQLTTLKGGPRRVSDAYVCSDNLLSSLEGIGTCEEIIINSSQPRSVQALKDLSHLPPKADSVEVSYNKQLPLLRLLSYNMFNVTKPPHSLEHPVQEILEEYANQGKAGVIKCAAALIKAGYKDNARW